MRSDDLAGLLQQDDPDIGYRQGRLTAYDPQTGEGTVRVAGGVLTDLPILSGIEATSLAAGMVVGLLRVRSQYFIIGRIVVPEADAIVEQDLFINGALVTRHANGVVGAVYGKFSEISTGGAEDGHGLLVQADDGADIFRAKVNDLDVKQVFVGATDGGGAPLPVQTFRSRSHVAIFHAYDGPEASDGQFRVETDTDIVLDPQSPSASQGVWISHATTSGTANTLLSTAGLVRRITSSRRYKQDIDDHYVDPGLVLELQPRSWRDKGEVETELDTTNRHVGLIAEEVDELGLTEFVTYNEDGEPESVAYDRLAVGLLDLLRQQQNQIDGLTAWATSRGYAPPDPPQAAHKPVRAVPRPAPRPQAKEDDNAGN